MNTYNHFIDGQYVEPVGKKWIDSIDPYLGQPWARIPQGCKKEFKGFQKEVFFKKL